MPQQVPRLTSQVTATGNYLYVTAGEKATLPIIPFLCKYGGDFIPDTLYSGKGFILKYAGQLWVTTEPIPGNEGDIPGVSPRFDLVSYLEFGDGPLQMCQGNDSRLMTTEQEARLNTSLFFGAQIDYISDVAYARDQMVRHEGGLYRCNTNIPFAVDPTDNPGVSIKWTTLSVPFVSVSYAGAAQLTALWGSYTSAQRTFIRGLDLRAQTAPTGSALLVEVVLNGTPTGKVATLAAAAIYQRTTFGTSVAVEYGDVVQMKFTQIGSTLPGQYIQADWNQSAY